MNELIEFVKVKIEEYSPSLPSSDRIKIKSFFLHDEYEMAFEGLVLELIRQDIHPKQKDINHWVSCGKIFDLESKSIFDEDFMTKMKRWIHNSQ